jgi:hypothetical protein
MVNAYRVLMRAGRVKIHPRCRNLVRHMETTLWRNELRNEFRRKNGEHGDLLDCAVYFARRAQFARNPYPLNWDLGPNMHRVHSGRIPDGDGRAAKVANVLYGDTALARRLRGGR